MANGVPTPPPPTGGGHKQRHKKGGGGGGGPTIILPSTVGSGKSKTSGSAERTVRSMFKKYDPKLMQYFDIVIAAAKTYGLDPAHVAALLIAEQKRKDGRGIAGITEGTIRGGQNRNPFVWPNGAGANTAYPGQRISNAQANSPMYAIFYMAWRLQGASGRGWPAAANSYDPHNGNVNQYIPKNYTPSAGNATGGVNTTFLKGVAQGQLPTKSNPWVIYNKKTGRVSYYYGPLNNKVLQYDGVPVTKDVLQREVQDKAGIGGDYYNFTGRSPNAHIVASVMASGRNLQQVENHWIMDTKNFRNSPAGKKYMAGYQDAWSQIMGRNSPIPWQLVQEAAMDNLNETEFAAKLRMDGFKYQKENNQFSYLNSNEFQSKVDSYTLSYEKIYGQPLKNTGMENLAKDAALAGWDPTQWEAYLRSQPEYTHTAEYQGHAINLLNQLGMDFGFVSGLGVGGYTPANPDNALPGPPTDNRVNNGQQPNVPQSGDNLGVVIPNA